MGSYKAAVTENVLLCPKGIRIPMKTVGEGEPIQYAFETSSY